MRCSDGVPPRETVQMAGENVIRVFGIDGDYLQKVAVDIGAQTRAQLADAPDPATFPSIDRISNAFRGQAGPRIEVGS